MGWGVGSSPQERGLGGGAPELKVDFVECCWLGKVAFDQVESIRVQMRRDIRRFQRAIIERVEIIDADDVVAVGK